MSGHTAGSVVIWLIDEAKVVLKIRFIGLSLNLGKFPYTMKLHARGYDCQNTRPFREKNLN